MKRTITLVWMSGVFAFGLATSFADINGPPACTWLPWQIVSAPSVTVAPPGQMEPPTAGLPVKVHAVVFPGFLTLSRSDTCNNTEVGYFPPTINSVTWHFYDDQLGVAALSCVGQNDYSATLVPQGSGQLTFTAQASFPEPHWDNSPGTTASCTVNVLPMKQLGYWRFNDTQFKSEGGETPSIISGVSCIASWNYGAAQVDATTGKLVYNAFQVDGNPNITHNAGSVCFWFRPNWNFNPGPNGAKLLEMYQGYSSRFCLRVDGTGHLALTFSSDDLCTSAVSLTTPNSYLWSASQWYLVSATYGRDGCQVLVNDVSQGAWTLEVPSLINRLSSFSVGGASDGTLQANGLIDELQTFNYRLSVPQVSGIYQAGLTLDTDGDGVSNLNELSTTPGHPCPTDPYNPDSDGDGVWDGVDPAATDPNVWDPPSTNDGQPPVITLLEPITATPL